MTDNSATIHLHKYARFAGILYLLIIVCAGFSEGYVRSTLVVTGDATTTANNIITSEALFRLGFASDLVAFMCDLVVAVLFFVLLRPVSNTIALLAMVLRLIAHPAIASINLLNHYNALLLLNNPDFSTAFSSEQLHSLVLNSLSVHHYGYLVAGAFFGLHLLLLGYLVYKSNFLPSIFGVLLVIAGGGYLVESFGNFLLPGYETFYMMTVAITAVIGEVGFTLWLLVKGVKHQTSS